MKEVLDEMPDAKVFYLSPSAYAELKEDLNVDILNELHRYKGIRIVVVANQEEDVVIK